MWTSSPAPHAGGPGGLEEKSTVDKAGDVVAGAGERLSELPVELVIGVVVGMAGAQASPLASNTRGGASDDKAIVTRYHDLRSRWRARPRASA